LPASIRPALEPALNERHYTVDEIAELWNLSGNTVRKLFRDEEGVLRVGEPSRLIGGRKKGYKRRYITLRISESAMARVRARLMHKRPPGIDGSGRGGSGNFLHAS
jgi:hypothetical protein